MVEEKLKSGVYGMSTLPLNLAQINIKKRKPCRSAQKHTLD